MAFVDYYKILEINKDASEADIKKAYRKLARKYHPDLNPNDKVAEQKFKDLNEANEVLSNPENRKKYDKYGADWKHGEEMDRARQSQQSGSRDSSTGAYSNFTEGDYSDFFESMFGASAGGGRQGGANVKFRGQDFHAEFSLDIKDTLKSQKQTININGKKINITIPAGIEDEQVLKLKNFGGQGINGGPNGDLFVKFKIVNETAFKRDKNDLYTTVPLDLYTAILGGEVITDTFYGKVKLKINSETRNDTKVKLKGKGLPLFNKESELGDLYISFQIVLPNKLSEQEKELFTTLQNLRKI
jgi:curved DNA-binding protein